MRSDIDDPVSTDTRSGIKLRTEQFELMWVAAGKPRAEQIAAELGMTTRTLRRVRTGVIGSKFMAQTVRALGRHSERLARYGLTPSLDALFEVVDQDAAA